MSSRVFKRALESDQVDYKAVVQDGEEKSTVPNIEFTVDDLMEDFEISAGRFD